jgi:hypothetical protein
MRYIHIATIRRKKQQHMQQNAVRFQVWTAEVQAYASWGIQPRNYLPQRRCQVHTITPLGTSFWEIWTDLTPASWKISDIWQKHLLRSSFWIRLTNGVCQSHSVSAERISRTTLSEELKKWHMFDSTLTQMTRYVDEPLFLFLWPVTMLV